jgi:hypothetical protein
VALRQRTRAEGAGALQPGAKIAGYRRAMADPNVESLRVWAETWHIGGGGGGPLLDRNTVRRDKASASASPGASGRLPSVTPGCRGPFLAQGWGRGWLALALLDEQACRHATLAAATGVVGQFSYRVPGPAEIRVSLLIRIV